MSPSRPGATGSDGSGEHDIGENWGGVRESAREFALSQMRRAIRTGELQGGEVVREEDWAARLGVSRTPLREAITELCVEGLLRKDGRSVYVFRPSLPELFEIYDIREQLEILASRRAATNPDPDTVTKLHEHVQRIRVVEPTDEWFASHEAFHLFISEASGMPRLANLIASLRAQSEPYVRIVIGFDSELRATAAAQHAEMYECIARGDRRAIASLVRNHLQATRGQVQKLLTAAGGTSRMLFS